MDSHRSDSNEYTQFTIFKIKKTIILDYSQSAAMGFFQGPQERVRNSRGRRSIRVRATEVILCNFGRYFMDTITRNI